MANVLLNESLYTNYYGGKCFIDYDPVRNEHIIIINNADVGTFDFRISKISAKYCTPDLVFSRIEDEYCRALNNRALHYYEDDIRARIEARESIDDIFSRYIGGYKNDTNITNKGNNHNNKPNQSVIKTRRN